MAGPVTRIIAGGPNWFAWALVVVFALIVFAVPVLNLTATPGSTWHVPDFWVTVLGKWICLAILALSIDLIWGYCGILSLGHGAFFALGGYCMGMYLMRSIGTRGVYGHPILPDFMVFLNWKELPWFWYGFQSFPFAMLMALFVPSLLAYVFGFFAFRSRIRGVYFSIITQAMTFALMLLFFRNNTGFGGNNGLTDFKRILGFPIHQHTTKVGLYLVTIAALILCYLLCRYVVASKLGRVLTAIRDAESRVMFSGYNPLDYKLFVWTLSATLCGLAGALYVPQVGIINPSEMQPSNSIEMAIWVAVGGRGTLVGAVIGSTIINAAKSIFTVQLPGAWLYVLGALFVGVTLFLPGGLMGLSDLWMRRFTKHAPKTDGAASANPIPPAAGQANS
jgi:urea transport system permease protein